MAMTAKERVLTVLTGGVPDRKPVLSVCQYATYGLMEKTGAFWPEAHYDGKAMAELALGGASVLHLDAVRVPFCQTVEAEIFGSTIKNGGKTHIPSIETPAFTLDDKPIIPAGFTDRGRIPAILEAITRCRKAVGEDVAVMGSIVGPFSVAANIIGIATLLKASLRKPEKLLPFFSAAEKTAEAYADAVINAGADAIVIEDMMASLDMISPKTYRTLAFPYEKQLVDHIGGRIPVIIHICGKLDMVMNDIAATGVSAISVESAVDIAKVKKQFFDAGISVPVFGSVHPIRVLLEGNKDDVIKAVRKSVEDGADAISPDCAVAPETPLENLIAMTEAVASL
ncbi:MAG: MtaA/CmuA family methyltransferase [Acidaminococcaceae bacterium]|nr:MtaA/CmuA family methyltransferase [Acidaminococcaceae bacterium]